VKQACDSADIHVWVAELDATIAGLAAVQLHKADSIGEIHMLAPLTPPSPPTARSPCDDLVHQPVGPFHPGAHAPGRHRGAERLLRGGRELHGSRTRIRVQYDDSLSFVHRSAINAPADLKHC